MPKIPLLSLLFLPLAVLKSQMEKAMPSHCLFLILQFIEAVSRNPESNRLISSIYFASFILCPCEFTTSRVYSESKIWCDNRCQLQGICILSFWSNNYSGPKFPINYFVASGCLRATIWYHLWLGNPYQLCCQWLFMGPDPCQLTIYHY